MKRGLVWSASMLLCACGSILGVQTLDADQPVVATPDASDNEDADAGRGPLIVDSGPAHVGPPVALDGGCFATAATPPRSATQDGNGNGWSSTDNVFSDDGQNAVANGCCSGDDSQTLHLRDFGFAIPEAATIQGLTVETKAKASVGGFISDRTLVFTVNGATSADLAKADKYGTDYEIRDYGTPTSVGGLGLTPAIVNGSDFGLAYGTTKPPGSPPIFLDLDVVRVTVYYCQ